MGPIGLLLSRVLRTLFPKANADVMSAPEHFEVVIPSDTSAGQAVQERIVQRLEELQFTSRDVFGVRLALEEALVNIIKHGYTRVEISKEISGGIYHSFTVALQ